MPGKRKKKYDWKTYNKQLVDRGRKLAETIKTAKSEITTFWEDELFRMNEGKEGARYEYPDSQIIFFSVLRSAFNINSYRNMQGFGFLFFEKVPDYTEINRRIRKLDPQAIASINREVTKARTKGKVINVLLDGTGVQVNGKYVWYDKKHNKEKVRKRDWRKLNIAIDVETKQILGIKVLGRDENEGSHKNTVELLDNTLGNMGESSKIAKAFGDGGYDNDDNFEMLEYLGIEPIIRIRKPSRKKAEEMSRSLMTKKRRKFFEKKRNKEALKQADWDNYVEDSEYGKRGGIEGIIGSFKRFFRENLFSKLDSMIEREILTRTLVWNIMN